MKYGFIGCGNMGGAIAKALSKQTKNIILSDPSAAVTLADTLGCTFGSNEDVINNCDCVFLAVKPQILEIVLKPLHSLIASKKPLIISMAAGIEIARIQSYIGCNVPIIRIMPNTPVSVGKGMISYCKNELVKDTEINQFLQDMQYAGQMCEIPERLMDAATAISGCGPAYMYMFLEALADGGVSCGLSREQALQYAAATMSGAAEMIIRTGKHPGELKDAVCSPGGSTIEGVKVLEENSFRGIVIDCVIAAYNKNKALGQ